MKFGGILGVPLFVWIVLLVAFYASLAIGGGFTLDDIATFFGAVSQPYQICFGVYAADDVSTSPGMPNWVQLRRTREEDLSQDYQQFFRTQWITSGSAPQGKIYCTPNINLPRQGHFSYEVRMCPTLPADPSMVGDCSPWVSSKDPTVAILSNGYRAWWIYGYADPSPPSGTTVNP